MTSEQKSSCHKIIRTASAAAATAGAGMAQLPGSNNAVIVSIQVTMMARSIKSKGLYVQCVSRDLRLAPEKKDCLFIDFVDIARKHELCNAGTLVGKKKTHHS